MAWLRVLFDANYEDYRSIKWPPVGPYWCTGYGDTYARVCAYVKTEEQIYEYWPEAVNLDVEEVQEIIFTDRFPKPEWWNENDTASNNSDV